MCVCVGSWCLEPSHPQRITSGLSTNFTLSSSYSFHKGTCIQQERPSLFCWPTQEPVLVTANTGKTRERFWEKMQVNGPEGWKLARKKSPAVSVACIAIYCPIPGFKGEPLSSVFSSDGTLISASAAPHCGT